MAYSPPQTFAELAQWAFNAPRVTYRTYGRHGEKRRPMMHRFPVKGGVSVAHVFMENLTVQNELFKRLAARAR